MLQILLTFSRINHDACLLCYGLFEWEYSRQFQGQSSCCNSKIIGESEEMSMANKLS